MLCSSATRFRRQAFVPKNLVKSRLKRTLIAASISALSFGANAAGLGRITVLSGLGQPLRAEVDISATPEELQNMTARLASAEAFRQAVSISHHRSVACACPLSAGAGAVVRVTSDRPINEPFRDMLVELNWSAGRLIREYTFLLDPPDLGSSRLLRHRSRLRKCARGFKQWFPASAKRPSVARVAALPQLVGWAYLYGAAR
jgi:pilus assembly protein FimV